MEWFNVGTIVNTHGIKGEVRVMSKTDFPDERYQVGSELAIFMPKVKAPTFVKVTSHRKHKNFDLLTFEGYPNINDVEKFRDGVIKVSEKELTELEENEFYYHEIIGCRVITETGEEIGTVSEIIETGANDVWEVTPAEGKPHYIPYIEDVVKDIDIDEQVIKIELMDGLLS
ncbi:ribosome maturation factor RimM [Sporosarcina sp. P26b]|uniref:ribosome maturation factor RimM n=1 Tax=Sporosarcina TaxID=1569 RepID=UPI000A17CD7C|nr:MULTISPECIES: ribosome maturation factor RimM [Sporosarcina]ARK22693.1 ribosome maturation factor RimM [Sporosarcina ureae]PIC75186.1 ribosome maturation factor RimM [Sporosarcina sp. P17b]PIC97150.1 ribosome maturation factor RimM [Sporosarcina sp. P26b]